MPVILYSSRQLLNIGQAREAIDQQDPPAITTLSAIFCAVGVVRSQGRKISGSMPLQYATGVTSLERIS